MNANECAVAQRMIVELDDSRVVYTKLLPLLEQFHLKYLITRIIASHLAIAEDLVRMMDHAGGVTARRGEGAIARARAGIQSWLALASVDVELGCISRIALRESELTERLAAAVDRINGVHPTLFREQRLLERALSQLESSSQAMQQAPPLARVQSSASVQGYPTRRRSRQ